MIYSTDMQKTFIGAPLLLDDVCLIKPMTVMDKIRLGSDYDAYLSLLTLSSSDIETILLDKVGEKANELEPISPFNYLLLSADVNPTFLIELNKAFSTFIREETFIVPRNKEIFVGELGSEKIINEDNFPHFQEIIRLQNHLEAPEEVPENENPMQRKFRLKRKLLKEAKAKQAARDEKSPEFLDLMSSICVMNIGITWNNIKDLPLYTFYELLGRNQKREKYDLDIKSLLAGADSKKIKLEYWINKNTEN